jgi:hypothetical protein
MNEPKTHPLLRLTLALAVLGGAMAAGCSRTTRENVVVSYRKPWPFRGEPYVPDVLVMNSKGKEASYIDRCGPFFLMTFIEPPAGKPCHIDPRVQELAGKVRAKDLTVVQVVLPTEDCPLGPEAVASCADGEENIRRLFDPERIAWRAYYQPEPGTLFLIDRINLLPVIVVETTLDDFDPLWPEIERLQDEWEDLRDD